MRSDWPIRQAGVKNSSFIPSGESCFAPPESEKLTADRSDVDGQQVGSAATGSTFEVYLSYGEHSVSIESNDATRFSSRRSSAETLNVPLGAKSVIVTIKPKGDVFSVFGGATKLGIANVEVVQ